MTSDSSMAIVNSSKWPSTQCITMASKHSLCQYLIADELIGKRLQSIRAFRSGLSIGNLLPVVARFPQQCRALFVHSKTPLTAAKLLSLIGTRTPRNLRHREVFDWFADYICERESSTGTSAYCITFISTLTFDPYVVYIVQPPKKDTIN